MLVCHCNVVTDRQIRAAISTGAHDVAGVGAVCGAGRNCGGCVPTVEQLLLDAQLALTAPETLRVAQARRHPRDRTRTASMA